MPGQQLKHWICGLFVAEITPTPLVRALEPLEYRKVMNTLSDFYKVFKRAKGEEFSHYDSSFRTQCLRLTEIGAPISGVCQAFWFLEKASISEELTVENDVQKIA